MGCLGEGVDYVFVCLGFLVWFCKSNLVLFLFIFIYLFTLIDRRVLHLYLRGLFALLFPEGSMVQWKEGGFRSLNKHLRGCSFAWFLFVFNAHHLSRLICIWRVSFLDSTAIQDTSRNSHFHPTLQLRHDHVTWTQPIRHDNE